MRGEIKRRRQAAYRKGFADGVASVAITDQPSPGKQTITGETVRGERCELPPPPSTHVRGLEQQIEAAREFVKRHPALTLIDLAEFEAFLKVPAAMEAAFATTEGQTHG